VATAAYQIEGSPRADGKGVSVWDTFAHSPGRIHHGDTGDIAADHYRRFEADVDLMGSLGINAYRFSIAWPRIQPDGVGTVNQSGLDFYKRLVEWLLKRSITPAITLYHWDLPQALADRGGWTNRDSAGWFAEYAQVVHSALADQVPIWITLNEPWVTAWMGYGSGVHPPGTTDYGKAFEVTHHQLLGHAYAAQSMRAAKHESNRIGISLNLSPIDPASDREEDVTAARLTDAYYNRLFLDPLFKGSYPSDFRQCFESVTDFSFLKPGDLEAIADSLDFLGVNYYTRQTVAHRPPDAAATSNLPEPMRAQVVRDPNLKMTAIGWPIQPAGLAELLVRIREEYSLELPMYVTENGAACNDYVNPDGIVDDPERIAFLDAHIRAMHDAIARGVDVRGYFLWTLMDNFEWTLGYSARFGIVFTDYRTQDRIPKSSARWYTNVIERNGFD
jgi:beta-glucosidase